MTQKADLHIHTKASDGEYSPDEVVLMAKDAGIKAIAITDHDTIAGVKEALDAGSKYGIHVIAGVEISAVFDKGTLHILGYFKNIPLGLEKELGNLQNAREERNPKIVKKLNALGFDITMKEVEEIAGSGQVGRPHIAKVLVQKGYADNFNDAFDRFLGENKPAYVDKERLSPEDAILLIQRHKGIPVLAHPSTLKIDRDELKALIEVFSEHGLRGIEAYYPGHLQEQIRFYKKLAKEYALIITGGTDFHGPSSGPVCIGDTGVDLKIVGNLMKLCPKDEKLLNS